MFFNQSYDPAGQSEESGSNQVSSEGTKNNLSYTFRDIKSYANLNTLKNCTQNLISKNNPKKPRWKRATI